MFQKIVVASDSFKGCLTAREVADAVAAAFPAGTEVVKLAMADGGEGTAETVAQCSRARMISAPAADPLMRPIEASYAIDGQGTAFVELAAASGLTLLREEERNPLLATTYGTGLLLADALKHGCRRAVICVGGSATNDCATGMLSALGFRFLDSQGNRLRGCGDELERITEIDSSGVIPELKDTLVSVACDVDAPFCGLRGAAYVFAAQKGADEATIERLDKGMQHFAEVIRGATGTDISNMRGAGAAGGVAGGLVALCRARPESGAALVAKAIGLEKAIEGASLVITGEGRIDAQTLGGKAPLEVMNLARKAGVPVIALAGRVENRDELLAAGFDRIIEVTPRSMPLSQAIDPRIAIHNITCSIRNFIA